MSDFSLLFPGSTPDLYTTTPQLHYYAYIYPPATAMTTPTTQDQLAAQILHSKSLPVSRTWLTSFLPTNNQHQRSVPLTATTQTALFRILASDFRQTLSTRNTASLLPANITDPSAKERRVPGPVPVQVVDIEDIGASIWSQVEAIERVERGEAVRGREIVRTVNVDEDSEEREQNNTGNNAGSDAAQRDAAGGSSAGPHRVTLEDAAGTRVVAVELKRVQELGIGKLAIGAKMLLKNATVARGLVLLTPECVAFLGGKIEHLDRGWKQSRKLRLLARIAEMEREQGGDATE